MYYDGTKLLSMLDINNKKPDIYICCTNRTAGKTTYFNRLVLNHFIKNKTKFMLLYRYNYEISDTPNTFFKDVGSLFFNKYTFTSEPRKKGVYYELFFNGESCGYACSLNHSEQIKKCSHIFSDVSEILMDEFQSESNKYVPNEINKFISIHTSIARGQGLQNRRVPVYLIGNAVSILNPYYTALGISSRLKNNTNFLRGDGYVLESSVNESAKNTFKSSAFNRAFKNEKQILYSSENKYLNDNENFLCNVKGQGRYLATVIYEGKKYAIREYEKTGIIYVNKNIDITFKTILSLTVDDHNINHVMLKNNSLFISSLRQLFMLGCFRFYDLECKYMIIKMLSY